MLVLSRKVGEKINIADIITITVTEVRGDRVRLGIDAPKDIPVHRGDIMHIIRRENELAAKAKQAESLEAEKESA